MSATTKVVGLIAGLSAVAVIGVAVAQGVPPNPYIANPALGAGQQSTHMTSMGETGVPGFGDTVRTATIVRQPEVALAPAPVVVAAQPAPAPVYVAEAQPAAQTMGAAPQEPAPMKMHRARRHDRG